MRQENIPTLITLSAVRRLSFFRTLQPPDGRYVKVSPNTTHAKISNLHSRPLLIAERCHATSAVS